jgi:cell division protein FtsW
MPASWRSRLFADRRRDRPGRGRRSERAEGSGHRERGDHAQRATRRARPGRAKRSAPPIEHSILLTATLCLLAAGAVMVYSASSARTLLQGHGNGSGYLVRFAIYGAIGLVVMRVLSIRGLETARRLTGPLLIASFVLVVAVHIPHVGVRVNGARRWIGPGALQFQPSEVMKLALVLYAAELLARRPQRVFVLKELLNPLLVVVGGACLLVATQPDIGTAMVIAFTLSALLVAAGMPLRHLAALAAFCFVCVVLYALVQPYSRARLTSFIDPWSHAAGTGFQAVQGQIAIGSGGLFGVGPGQSVQKIFYLPEAHTDFILAVIGEELGVVGVCGLLCLYGLIAFAGLRAARAARSLYAALVAVGITALILSQATLNVFAVLGLAPLTGVPLPFVSYGSSNLIVMLAAMGMLLNVASGGTAHLRAVAPPRPRRAGSDDTSRRESARWSDAGSADEDRDRRRRDRGARRAGAGRGRRAAG